MSDTPSPSLLSEERLAEIAANAESWARTHIANLAFRYGADVPDLLADRAARGWIAGEPSIAGRYLAVVTGYAGSNPTSHPPYMDIRDYDPARPEGFRWSLGGGYYQVSHYALLLDLPAPSSSSSK